jgi:hypothetical protein
MSTRETVTIKTHADRNLISTWARNVEPGTVVTFRKKSRSTEQNSKLHAMLGEVSKQIEWYGQYHDIEDWKDMFTASLRHARVVPGIDKGTYVPLGMHTSTLTIEEMSNLIELIYAFGADPDHPVIFKDPKQHDSGEPLLSPDTADGSPSSAPADSVSPGAVSQPIEDWLPTVARMLWSATHAVGDTDANLDLLNNQRIACNAMPGEPSQEERNKAGSIYRLCKQVVEKSVYPPEALEIIARHAGCTESQITIGANHEG